MNKFLKALLYTALIFFVIFAAIQPYNWFCNLSKKCSAVKVSKFLSEKEGNRQITIFMEAIDLRDDIDFEVLDPKMIMTVSGRDNKVFYRVTNLSNKTVNFRPEFRIEPSDYAKLVDREECLCFREYKIEKGEELILPASFKIKGKINKEPADKNLTIRLIYTAKK